MNAFGKIFAQQTRKTKQKITDDAIKKVKTVSLLEFDEESLGGVIDMRNREFTQPTEKEITERKKMYDEAEELGIDLMAFDGESEENDERKDVHKAIFFLGTGRQIPKEIRDRLIKRKQQREEIQGEKLQTR